MLNVTREGMDRIHKQLAGAIVPVLPAGWEMDFGLGCGGDKNPDDLLVKVFIVHRLPDAKKRVYGKGAGFSGQDAERVLAEGLSAETVEQLKAGAVECLAGLVEPEVPLTTYSLCRAAEADTPTIVEATPL